MTGQIPRVVSKTTYIFLKYGGVMTTQVLSAHYRHTQGSCELKNLR